MNTNFKLDTIIFYVQNVERLKVFYSKIFGFEIIEEFQSSWALLANGQFKIGLHEIGLQYQDKSKASFKFDNNTKIVFEIDEDINKTKAELISQGVVMREIKTFENYNYWLCDGEDPEGNIFQIKQEKQLDF